MRPDTVRVKASKIGVFFTMLALLLSVNAGDALNVSPLMFGRKLFSTLTAISLAPIGIDVVIHIENMKASDD